MGQVFVMLWENLPAVILGAVGFSLCAMPAFVLFSVGFLGLSLVIGVLTIAPAWAALLAYEIPIYTDRVTHWPIFWLSMLHFWRRGALLGAIGAIPIFSAYFKLPLLNQEQISNVLWLSYAADFLIMAVFVALSLYAFPLMVSDDLMLSTALRNAWILVGRQPINTIGLLAMGILFVFAVAYLSLGLLFVLPAIFGLFVVGNCLAVLQKA